MTSLDYISWLRTHDTDDGKDQHRSHPSTALALLRNYQNSPFSLEKVLLI